MAMIWIQTVFKLIRLAIIIVMISYFAGTFFFIIADLTNDMHVVSRHVTDDGFGHNFIEFFGIDQMT
jgi:hypothetical protein